MGGHPGTTLQGYDIQFGTNHMGHALLLLELLIPLLLGTASNISSPPRVISLSSNGHGHAAALPPGGIAFSILKSSPPELSSVNKYTQSILVNILYALQYALQYL
ncbi:hypothetical protein G6011_00355 [Alternaria panax]|uniref:Uncharacterized protein n=1 Tax=Alternaria panax TaxID=48097 RepID=A0AAD4NVP3_9PLEO|nr:hypothetical protein G6011_00355 [Alternaria panax]